MQRSSSANKTWQTILAVSLLGIGILGFAFYFIGKALNDINDEASRSSSDSPLSAEQTLVLISKDSNTFGTIRRFSDLEAFFGREVVFVSASEPAFLMTDDERRFTVGDNLGVGVELTKISTTQLVLKEAEAILVFPMPVESAN